MDKGLPPPSLKTTFMGPARTATDIYQLRGKLKDIKPEIEPGNGQPVMILPGFGVGDVTSKLLRNFLNKQGYNAYGWDNGLNLAVNAKTAEHMENRLKEISKAHGGQKVTLIGHSLGGILVRELAREHPNLVKEVITLGSPFGSIHHKASTALGIRSAIMKLTDMGHLLDNDMADQMLTPPPVPTTSIYTQNDGIVNWKTCLNPDATETQNLEILNSSHAGLIVNGTVFLIIADRLSQPEGQWKPFDPSKYPSHIVEEINTEPSPHAPDLPAPDAYKIKSFFRPPPPPPQI